MIGKSCRWQTTTAMQMHWPFLFVLTLIYVMYFEWVCASSHSSLTASM